MSAVKSTNKIPRMLTDLMIVFLIHKEFRADLGDQEDLHPFFVLVQERGPGPTHGITTIMPRVRFAWQDSEYARHWDSHVFTL